MSGDDFDDYVLRETIDNGRSARSLSRELRCPVSEIHASLDRSLPVIDNEFRARQVALDLQRLDMLLAVFLEKAKNGDQPSGMLVTKILERKSYLIGLDQPQKLDIFQLQVRQQVCGTDRIMAAIERIARGRLPPPTDSDDGSGSGDLH
jgi:hypothetical protein